MPCHQTSSMIDRVTAQDPGLLTPGAPREGAETSVRRAWWESPTLDPVRCCTLPATPREHSVHSSRSPPSSPHTLLGSCDAPRSSCCQKGPGLWGLGSPKAPQEERSPWRGPHRPQQAGLRLLGAPSWSVPSHILEQGEGPTVPGRLLGEGRGAEARQLAGGPSRPASWPPRGTLASTRPLRGSVGNTHVSGQPSSRCGAT